MHESPHWIRGAGAAPCLFYFSSPLTYLWTTVKIHGQNIADAQLQIHKVTKASFPCSTILPVSHRSPLCLHDTVCPGSSEAIILSLMARSTPSQRLGLPGTFLSSHLPAICYLVLSSLWPYHTRDTDFSETTDCLTDCPTCYGTQTAPRFHHGVLKKRIVSKLPVLWMVGNSSQ